MTESLAMTTPAIHDLLYYTRCPAPTATGLAFGLSTLAPALRDIGIRIEALQDVVDANLKLRHFDHGITNLIREGGNIPAIWARASGAPTRLLGITWLDEFQAIVTTPETGIRSGRDLAGKRLPIPAGKFSVVDVAGASSRRGIQQGLRSAGLSFHDVKLESVEPKPRISRGENWEAELDLLAAGRVDAVWLKGAAGVRSVRERGLVEVVRIDALADPVLRVNNGTPRTLTVRQELVDSRPDLVRIYHDTVSRAYGAVGDDRARLWQTLSGETQEAPEDAEVAYVRVEADSLVPSLSANRINALQDQADFLFEFGFVPSRVDVAAWALELSPAGLR